MKIGRALKACIALAIILLIAYFYNLELRKNWSSLQHFRFSIDMRFLIASLAFYLFSYLLETFIWKICINSHLRRPELNFFQSIAVVNASGLLKYLPGRIWTYTAQLVWLQKYGIPMPLVLHVNLICILGSLITSLYLGMGYLALYKDFPPAMLLFLSALLVLCNIAYIAWNSVVINKLISVVNRLFKRGIQPIADKTSLVVIIQIVYMLSWCLMGSAGYLLAKGVGLNIPHEGLFAILASMSLAWLIGYLAIIFPGGLGVREGVMLVMLTGVVDSRIALIFPIISRVMYLISEGLLGIAAAVIGIKYDVFSPK